MKTRRDLRLNAGRTIREQKDRDALCNYLKKLRLIWCETWEDLARNFLESERKKAWYLTSLWTNRVTKEDIYTIIKKWSWEYVAKNLEKFEWLDRTEISKCLIQNRKGYYVLKYFDKFWSLDYRDAVISERMKSIVWNAWKKEWEFDLLIKNLDKIDWLDSDFVDCLLKGADYLLDKLRSWKCNVVNKCGGSSFDYQLGVEIQYITSLIKYKKYHGKIVSWIIVNFEKFDEETRIEIWCILFERGLLRKYLESFDWLDKKILERLIEKWKYCELATNIKRFRWIDHKGIADIFIKRGEYRALALNIENFKWVNLREIIKILSENGCDDILLAYPEKFI